AVHRQISGNSNTVKPAPAVERAAVYRQTVSVNAVLVLADAVDRAAGYRQIIGRDAGMAALGGQAAAAGDGQIPVHENAVVKRSVFSNNSGSALQTDGQLALGIDAVGCLPI